MRRKGSGGEGGTGTGSDSGGGGAVGAAVGSDVTVQQGDGIVVEKAERTFKVSHGRTGAELPEYAGNKVIQRVLTDRFGHVTEIGAKDLDGIFDGRYLRKDVADGTDFLITFGGGARFGQYVAGRSGAMIDGQGNAEFLSVAVREMLRSAKFTDGMFGEGFRIWTDPVTGLASMTLDRLTVRQSMVVAELLIEKIRSVGGQIAVSAANGTIKGVEVVKAGLSDDDFYRITFEGDNEYVAGDLIRCQTFKGGKLKSYWVEALSSDATGVVVAASEFNWELPEAGDETVLMGSVSNGLRRNLISISATEDGQPRIDVLDGVKEKNFNGALRARLGNLDGISDGWFPADSQPHGNGLYADNAYLHGTFILVTGEDVKTRFEIIEGRFESVISAVIEGKNGNVLKNASFLKNLWYWTAENLVHFIDVPDWLHVGGSFYAEKENVCDIVNDGVHNVLRIKASRIRQEINTVGGVAGFDGIRRKSTGFDGGRWGST